MVESQNLRWAGNVVRTVEKCAYRIFERKILISTNFNIPIRRNFPIDLREIWYRSWNKQFAVTHTIRQTKIPALVDSCVINTPFVKMLFPEKNCFLLYFRTIITRWLSVFWGSVMLSLSAVKLCIGGNDNLLFHERYVGGRWEVGEVDSLTCWTWS
jgi:hypothetical protein